MSRVAIEDYTQKSFVVRGETQPYKDSLKAMGGKWNTMLTDKETGQKFGAWIFWADKRTEIEEWYSNGMPAISDATSVAKPTTQTQHTNNIEARLERIEKMLQELLKLQGCTLEIEQPPQSQIAKPLVTEKISLEADPDQEEDEEKPVRRLMASDSNKVVKRVVKKIG